MKKMYIFLTFIFLIIIVQILYLNVFNHEYYSNALSDKTDIYVYGESAPRGRILDVNGNVLVDNKEIYVINYVKTDESSYSNELSTAYLLAEVLDYTLASDSELCNYLIDINSSDYLLTDAEITLVDERKLDSDSVLELQLSRCDTSLFNDLDKEAISIYLAMNTGYSYVKKELISDISYEQFATISEMNLSGILAETSYIREYPYGDVLSSILGDVGSIYLEDADYYTSLGYSLSDEVGTSYLEKEYESILKGSKAIYKLGSDNELVLVKEATAGNDLYLSIDIEIQLELESILENEMIEAKSYPNTDYFTDLYAAISDPTTGEIIAISAKRLIDNDKNYSFTDITNLVLSSSFTPGSIVKAASLSVGYNNDLIEYNETVVDDCVKLYLVPEKCSWKSLGTINDIDALKQSSNYYQYLIAIKLTGNEYSYNIDIDASIEDFDVYRTTFEEFGLGTYTGIDLPGEATGVTGSVVASDLLLNLAIGQYDTYTVLQMLQYINTIANYKERLSLSLAKEAYNSNGELVYIKSNEVLNTLSVSDEGFSRIQEGLNLVTSSGTGYGYFPYTLDSAGKTGTSESYLDSDNDGNIDTKTYTRTFVGYAPFDEPEYSLVVVAPHIGYDTNEEDSYIYNLPRYTTLAISTYLFS